MKSIKGQKRDLRRALTSKGARWGEIRDLDVGGLRDLLDAFIDAEYDAACDHAYSVGVLDSAPF